MKFSLLALLMVLVSLCGIKSESVFSYDGYKVYDVRMHREEDVRFLSSLESRDGHDIFDIWAMPSLIAESSFRVGRWFLGSTATLCVGPKEQSSFERELMQRGMKFNVKISDLGKNFADEKQQQRSSGSITQRYFRYDEILKFLDSVEATSNSSRVKVKTVGKSFEGRDLKTITITNGDARTKNSIFIDAGIHAREWIAPAMALYVIQELTNNPNSELLDDFDFVIMPVVNPDGYEYTHQRQRLWRKTRSTSSSGCVGVDGNRNFDFHWAEVGASPNPCSETFRGQQAFSENETKILRDVVMEIRDTCKMYLTLHSYGNYILYPWGWTEDLPDSWKVLDEIAQSGAQAIAKATGTKYTVGSSTNVLYAAAGGSDDFMFAVANIPISFTMELPGGGSYGFDPPASKIKGIVEETFEGVKAMTKSVAEKYRSP